MQIREKTLRLIVVWNENLDLCQRLNRVVMPHLRQRKDNHQ